MKRKQMPQESKLTSFFSKKSKAQSSSMVLTEHGEQSTDQQSAAVALETKVTTHFDSLEPFVTLTDSTPTTENQVFPNSSANTMQNSCKIAFFATVSTSISRRSPTSFFRTTPLLHTVCLRWVRSRACDQVSECDCIQWCLWNGSLRYIYALFTHYQRNENWLDHLNEY